MKMLLTLIIGIVILVSFVALLKNRIVVEPKVKIADVPGIFEKLRATEKDGSFAVLAFTPPGESEAVNIQFSIEGGRTGLDWVLIGPLNIRDKEKFARFADKLGYRVSEREMNNVKYLRVEEGGSLPQLCQASISSLYSVPPEAELDLIPQGFTWP
jgi:hypothetical protein